MKKKKKISKKKTSRIGKLTKPIRDILRISSLGSNPFPIHPFALPNLRREISKKPKEISSTESVTPSLESSVGDSSYVADKSSQYGGYSRAPSTSYGAQKGQYGVADNNGSYKSSFSGMIANLLESLEGLVKDSSGNMFIFSTFEKRKGVKGEKYHLDQEIKMLEKSKVIKDIEDRSGSGYVTGPAAVYGDVSFRGNDSDIYSQAS